MKSHLTRSQSMALTMIFATVRLQASRLTLTTSSLGRLAKFSQQMSFVWPPILLWVHSLCPAGSSISATGSLGIYLTRSWYGGRPRQTCLHPILLSMLLNQLSVSNNIPRLAQNMWRLLLEVFDYNRSTSSSKDLFLLQRSLSTRHWTPHSLRIFEVITEPTLQINRSSGLGKLETSDKDLGRHNDERYRRIHLAVPRSSKSRSQNPGSHFGRRTIHSRESSNSNAKKTW